jgi:hypothetical protein
MFYRLPQASKLCSFG